MLRAENTSVVPPEFPKKGTQTSYNGLTRTSLLHFREIRSGATNYRMTCALTPAAHSLNRSMVGKLPIHAFNT